MKPCFSAAAGWVFIALATPGFAQTHTFYKVESATAADLGALGGYEGYEAEARDINNQGAIVGWLTLADGKRRSFYYVNGFMRVIGPLDLFTSRATGVNDSGEVVGTYFDDPEGGSFYWHSNVGYVRMRDQVYPARDYVDLFGTGARAINLHGHVVGGAWFLFQDDGDPPPQPCYVQFPVKWQTPTSYPESLFCPYNANPDPYNILENVAYDINNSGEIAVTEEAGIFKGYVWKDGVRDRVPFPDLQSDSQNVKVFGINESGNVVGAALHDTPGPSLPKNRAIYWDRFAAKSTLLPLLPGGDSSEAFEVNDSSFVAGYSKVLIDASINPKVVKSRAILWHPKIGTYQLPLPPGFTPASTDCRAYSLNNRVEQTGRIDLVGYCQEDGEWRAIRWRVIVSKQTLPIGL